MNIITLNSTLINFVFSWVFSNHEDKESRSFIFIGRVFVLVLLIQILVVSLVKKKNFINFKKLSKASFSWLLGGSWIVFLPVLCGLLFSTVRCCSMEGRVVDAHEGMDSSPYASDGNNSDDSGNSSDDFSTSGLVSTEEYYGGSGHDTLHDILIHSAPSRLNGYQHIDIDTINCSQLASLGALATNFGNYRVIASNEGEMVPTFLPPNGNLSARSTVVEELDDLSWRFNDGCPGDVDDPGHVLYKDPRILLLAAVARFTFRHQILARCIYNAPLRVENPEEFAKWFKHLCIAQCRLNCDSNDWYFAGLVDANHEFKLLLPSKKQELYETLENLQRSSGADEGDIFDLIHTEHSILDYC